MTREYEVDDNNLDESTFYVEKETGLLYEVKLFPDFALIRPIIPEAQITVTRIDLNTFVSLFDEYHGDAKELRAIMFGSAPSRILIEKREKKKK